MQQVLQGAFHRARGYKYMALPEEAFAWDASEVVQQSQQHALGALHGAHAVS